ncbi:GlxA family transcriptional regulator [Tahibacter amnicola]|uniref:DJ-1/PfpI family protein n=1 Tax=Tahibacter amnicola TaxID=2976241 RepID=A0ABY6BH48_9GAMM|nr:DJ-1/PfpI family protein [Tahibacter amnicola]UXI67931.1 DJ-1/PfpI family protein [Tahibacter amnicola]
MPAPRDIVIVIYPGIESLDLSGPASVFSTAGHAGGSDRYRIHVVAAEPGAVPTESGFDVCAKGARGLPKQIDTLLVPGGLGTREAMKDRALIALLARLAARSRRVTAVCSGAFLLAQAGLLDGRRATTHWRYAALLARLFPAVSVASDAIFIRDGNRWTSAGVTAGIDLALALVEADHGRELALAVARELVCSVRRSGGQSQYSEPLALQVAQTPRLERVRSVLLAPARKRMVVKSLAERVHVGERQLRRLTQREFGQSPRQLLLGARLAQAQQSLVDTDRPVRAIARQCGYATTEAFTRRFRAQFGVSPSHYRAQFRRTTSPTEALP